LILTLTIQCVLCRSGSHSYLVRLKDSAELLQPPVTSRVEAACYRDEFPSFIGNLQVCSPVFRFLQKILVIFG
jgi:hypothetical protein